MLYIIIAARSVDQPVAALLEDLQPSVVKAAGSFLDGCRIFLSGFTESEAVQVELR